MFPDNKCMCLEHLDMSAPGITINLRLSMDSDGEITMEDDALPEKVEELADKVQFLLDNMGESHSEKTIAMRLAALCLKIAELERMLDVLIYDDEEPIPKKQ